MIPAGKPHNEILLGREAEDEQTVEDDEGAILV